VHPLFRSIISNVAPGLDAPHPTRRADGRTPNPLVADTALLYDVLSSPPEKFGRLSDGELFADAFDGGCPADVTTHTPSPATRQYTAAEDRASSNRAAKHLLENLRKRIDRGDMRDLREVSSQIELATLLMK
jgi:hypothetical protein